MKKKVLLIILCCTLVGCAFHRSNPHSPSLAQKYPDIHIHFSHDTYLHQLLGQTFLKAGVNVHANQGQRSLKVTNQTLETRPLVYALDGELRREQMQLSIAFEWVEGGQSTPFTLSTVRERAIISRQRLAADIEYQQIQQSMQQDIVKQLIRYLRFA